MANDVGAPTSHRAVHEVEPPSGGARPTTYLKFRNKASYALGDVASQLAWSLGTSYLALFYTDSVGLAVGSVAALMLIARVVDAVIDPFIGGLAERTKSKHGRFRPWILFGAPLLGVMLVLTFTGPFGSGTGGFLWAMGTYLLLGILYSAVNVPYGSLSMVMSPDSGDRVQLNSFRMIGTNVGAVVLALVSAPLIVWFSGVGDGETMLVKGYTLTALVMAVLSVALFYVLFANSREIVQPIRRESVPFRDSLRSVVSNAPLMALFAAQLLVMIGFFGRLGTVLYYYIYDVARFDLISVLMTAPALAGVVGIVAFARPGLARKVGKKRLAMIANAASGLLLLALYAVGYSNVTVVVVLTLLYGVANFGIAIMMSMIPDAIDDGEVRKGIRADGTGYAAVSFAQKVGTAVGSAVGIALLGAFGYVANQHQTPEAMQGINVVVNVFPAVCFLLSLIPLAAYHITETRHAANRAALDALRAETTEAG